MDYVTCQDCRSIGLTSDTLDGKPICSRCLHKRRHGVDVFERCGLRGYHMTQGSVSDTGYERRDDGYYFPLRIICLCRFQIRADLKSPSPVGAGLISMPELPKKWTVIESQFTPLPDDFEQSVQREL